MVSFKTAPDDRVSLIPLSTCTGANLSGTAWPLDGETIALGDKVSISNCAKDEVVEASIESGAALLFFETTAIVW